MSKGRRLLFNFEDIFNDHRKLCYLFVDVANFKTVNDFKVHVLSGFNIKEPIYFSDNDNVLFPDFDDIRSVINFPEIIWVRKLKNHLNLHLPENDVPASVNTSLYNFYNDSPLVSCSDTLFNGQDEASFTKVDKDKEIKRIKKKNKKEKKNKESSIENNCKNICNINALEENNEKSLVKRSNSIHEMEINNYVSKSSSTDKVNDEFIQDIDMTVSCDKFNQRFSDLELKLFACNSEKLNSNNNQNFKIADDLSLKNYNKSTDNLDLPEKESKDLHNTNDEARYGINGSSDFGRDHSVFNDSSILEEANVPNEFVGEKVKRKRKRTRKRKTLEFKEVDFDKYNDKSSNAVKTEMYTDKVCDSQQKHIRFESDNESNNSLKDNGHVLNSESFEPRLKESFELDNSVKLDCVSTLKTEEYTPYHIDVVNEVSGNKPKNVVNNYDKSEKIKNCNDYRNGELNFHSDHENNVVEKKLITNWDKKDESSENICGELLKLKDLVKKTSYFNPPVFNRIPKSIVQKPSETTKNNLSISNGSTLDQSVNASDQLRNTMDDVTLKVDDIVNFKILFLSADYTPSISDNVMGRVISVNDEVIKFKILLGKDICKPLTGKFSLTDEDGNEDCDIVELQMEDLINPKKIFNPFSLLNQ